MNAACPRRVSLIIASGLPAIPSPTICGSAGTVPAVAGLSRRDRLRLALADSPNLADRIEFTATTLSDSLCYGLVVLSPLLSTPHYCDAVTVRYRTALHRTETDSHRSIPSPSQAHERGCLSRSVPPAQAGLNLARPRHSANTVRATPRRMARSPRCGRDSRAPPKDFQPSESAGCRRPGFTLNSRAC